MDEEQKKEYEEEVSKVLEHLKDNTEVEISKDGKTVTVGYDIDGDGDSDIEKTVPTMTALEVGLITLGLLAIGYVIWQLL